jgi:L-fuconolactonase
MTVIDSHHHFLDPSRRDYPWMGGDEMAPIRRPFGPSDLRPLLKASGVDRTVVVQAIPSVDETRELLASAAETEFLAGVIGWVDLTGNTVAKTIAGLRAGRGGAFLVGIRHQVLDEPDPIWLLRKDVQQGIREVGEAGLVFDLLVRTREMPAALELVRNLPTVRFVIDHIGKPRIAEGATDPEWQHAIAPFSECANVACKLSGLVNEASWTDWTPDDLRPYVRRVLGWFGPDRCIFGSDWPVSLLAGTYEEVVNAMREVLSDVRPTERDSIFGGNAIRIYGLTF